MLVSFVIYHYHLFVSFFICHLSHLLFVIYHFLFIIIIIIYLSHLLFIYENFLSSNLNSSYN